MTVLAAGCGVMIVLLGFWSTGHNPTDSQSAVEIICLVGGLILCFLAVVLARLKALSARLESFEIEDVASGERTRRDAAAAPRMAKSDP